MYTFKIMLELNCTVLSCVTPLLQLQWLLLINNYEQKNMPKMASRSVGKERERKRERMQGYHVSESWSVNMYEDGSSEGVRMRR